MTAFGEPGVDLFAKMAICLVLAGVLTGCTSPPPAAERPAPTTPSTTMPPLAEPVVTALPPAPPGIDRPLDAGRYATKDTVCDLLSDTAAGEFGLQRAGNPFAGDGGLLTCSRNGFGTSRDVEYNLWADSDVFAAQFGDRRRQGGDDAYLVDVAGQPAVVNGSDPKPACLVTVGLAARQGVEVLASDSDDHACALAVAVAERMVRTITG